MVAPPLTVAAAQCAPLFDDIPAASAHILTTARAAAAQGASLLLVLEAWLQGHSYDAATIARRALSLDDPALIALADELAPLPIMAIIGLFERRGDALFNSAALLSGGRVIGHYAKADPNERGVTPGTDRPIFACNGWPFAISICKDSRDPQLAQQFARRGARLLCYPLNNMLPTDIARQWRSKTPQCHAQRARETGCWVLSADVAGTHEGWVSRGSTRLFRPDGTIAAQLPEGEPGLLVGSVD